MKEHPILFSGPMVQALLADRKFVTRRLSPQWLKVKAGDRLWVRESWYCDHCFCNDYEQSGFDGTEESKRSAERGWRQDLVYRADGERPYEAEQPKWRPSIHMPRWASRITLEALEDTREERLWDITEGDAEAEGAEFYHGPAIGNFGWRHDANGAYLYDSARRSFSALWSMLHTKPGERWEDNPTVYRVGRFRRVEEGGFSSGGAQ